MNVGKAIYYLLANNANVSAITTRIYPEFAPPDATTPFIAYTISNVQPDDTHDGPAVIDEVRMDVICVDDTYDGAADLASVVRVALDRVYGTYNTVNVESIQFTDANIEVRDTPRQYGQDLTFIVRVKRDNVQIATGSPIEDLNLWRLADVDDEIVNALDRQALVYDEATSQWIADGVGQVVIPVRNPSRDPIAIGTVLKATGAQGDRILVAPFNVGDDPKLLVGVASEVLGNTDATKDGHAQVYGELRNVDTDLYPVGTILYAGDDGALSTTVSEHPIAIVTRQHENTGRIFIRTWIPGRSRYNSEVETLRAEMESSFANADVELMFSAQADGFGVAYSPESDSVVNNTPAEDYQVERAIYYNNTGLASYVSDTGWSTLTQNTENYAAAKARVEDYIRGGTYGKLPCTFAIVRTEESAATGLLVDYPGAAAAYSLRSLDSDYAGSAIRVRRASDNTEQDIGFNGNGDLDTASLVSFGQGEVFVKTWYDQSGNGNDATQTITGNQPQICTARTNLLLQSNTFDTTWNTGGGTLTSGQLGYDGTNSAWRFQNPGTTTPVYQTNTSSGVQTLSAYFKKNATYGVRLYAFGTTNANAFFNLNTGTVVNQTNTISANIEAIGSDWFRCSITFDSTLTRCDFYVTNNASTQVLGEYTIQDAQLEAGSSATAYIETTTSAVSVSEVITENGKPAVHFDGSSILSMSHPDIYGQARLDAYIAYATSDNSYILFHTLNPSNKFSFVVEQSSNITGLAGSYGSPDAYVNGVDISIDYGVTTRNDLYNAMSRGSMTLEVHQNATTSTWEGFDFSGYTTTTERLLVGNVSEIVLYNSSQSSNRTGIESNINDYYSIYTP